MGTSPTMITWLSSPASSLKTTAGAEESVSFKFGKEGPNCKSKLCSESSCLGSASSKVGFSPLIHDAEEAMTLLLEFSKSPTSHNPASMITPSTPSCTAPLCGAGGHEPRPLGHYALL